MKQTSGGTRWTYTASGPVTNLAARITALAEGGTLPIGPETARRVAGLFTMREFGPRQLKNIAKAVTLFQILGAVEQ
jgi:class 3 adenylate cyclase